MRRRNKTEIPATALASRFPFGHKGTMRAPTWFHPIALVAGLVACSVPPASARESTTIPVAADRAPVSPTTVTLPRHDLPGLPNFAWVSPDLCRGAQPTAKGFRRLREMGVKTVVSLRLTHSDRDLLRGTGLRYLRIPTEPWDPEADEMVRFLKVLSDPENRPVFVHCAQGVDRTGAAVAVYRMVGQDWTTDAAISELDRFGHHTVFTRVKKLLRGLDRDRMRARVKTAPSPQLECIP